MLGDSQVLDTSQVLRELERGSPDATLQLFLRDRLDEVASGNGGIQIRARHGKPNRNVELKISSTGL